ncbi:MAG: V-type ATP synthase subunit F [Dictyoglomus sp.]|nr:V-type ATP synthase subunit F [Dictyoglomus sp.]MCX7942010.1 V-type ATP synthase subunit F [Dictyoglomaceae bacterium]MDW8188728.1 V-type ATP synthase subunit F [Dictyoglomus sp.]
MSEGKIAIIGFKDLIEIFKIFGVETFSVENDIQALNVFDNLSERDYKLIIILESVSQRVLEQKTKKRILILPDTFSNFNLGMEIIRKNIEKVLGVDILSEGEGYYERKNY